jgi:DNA-binding winged helix-turn-helix (wHTH) protein/Tol biopolymer transport system component
MYRKPDGDRELDVMQGQRNGRVLQFGAFEFRTDTGEVRKHGTKVRLQGKPLQMLHALLDRPGDVITREELRALLWAADTFVDFESGLNTTVNRLRLALGDSADHPRYVETLARSGYRFVAPIVENHQPLVEEEATAIALPLPPAPAPVVPIAPPASRKRSWTVAALAIVLAIAGGILLLMRQQPLAMPAFHQLTFRRTSIRAARFGPDGQSVIYEGREMPNDRELYLVNPISPESRALGFPRAMLSAVSRSGELALVTYDSKGPNLVRVPMNGGAPLPLDNGVWTADWAPDGSRLAVIRYEQRPSILEYPRGKRLYESQGWLSDVRVSRSGDQVAFIDHPIKGDDGGSVMVIDGNGERGTLSSGWASADGLAWSPNGREIWFTAARSGVTRALYAHSLSRRLRLIAAYPGTLTLFDVSSAGRVLVAREQLHGIMTGFFDGSSKEKDLTWFDYSTVTDISADGHVVLFGETGEGGGAHHAVYVRHADSASAVRVGEGFAMAISPDGNWVITRPDGNQTTLNLVPLTPGQSRVISGHGLTYDFVRFFPGGDRLLVGGSMAGEPPHLYLQALDGSKPVALRGGVYLAHPEVSGDGRRIAGVDGNRRLIVLPAAGGEPKVVATDFALTVVRWGHTGDNVLAQSDAVPASLVRVDLKTGHLKPWKEIAPFHLAGVSMLWPAVLSQDERTVVYSYPQKLSELFVVDGWR